MAKSKKETQSTKPKVGEFWVTKNKSVALIVPRCDMGPMMPDIESSESRGFAVVLRGGIAERRYRGSDIGETFGYSPDTLQYGLPEEAHLKKIRGIVNGLDLVRIATAADLGI